MQSKGFSIFSSNPVNANPYINNSNEEILKSNKNKPLSARDKSNLKNGGSIKMKRPVSANPRLRASSAQHAIAAKPPPQNHNLNSPNAKKITESETANLLTFEREDLVKTILMMKKEVRVLESVNSQLRAENQRMENEVSKQQRRIDKLLSPLMTKSGVAVLEMRKEIEKSVLVRQLKTQIQVLRNNVTEKTNEMENLLKSQKTSQVMELIAEKDEFYQEIQRLRQLLRDKTEEISREHQHREWDKNVSLNREVDLKREIERLSTGYLDLLNRLNNGTLQLPVKTSSNNNNNSNNISNLSTNHHHHPVSTNNNITTNATATANVATNKSQNKSPVWHDPTVPTVGSAAGGGGHTNSSAGNNDPHPPPSSKNAQPSQPSQTAAAVTAPLLESTATRSRGGIGDHQQVPPVAANRKVEPTSTTTTANSNKREGDNEEEEWEEYQSPSATAIPPTASLSSRPQLTAASTSTPIPPPITTTTSNISHTIRSSAESASSNYSPNKVENKELEPLLCGIGGYVVGDLLEGKFQDKRRWYKCQVVEVHADTGDYDLLYDDGEQEHHVPHTRLRPRPETPRTTTTMTALTSTPQATTVSTDTSKKSQEVSPRQITDNNNNNNNNNNSRHSIDKKPLSESAVDNNSKFSVGDKVEAKYGGGIKYFPGTILYCHVNGASYDIRYEDGDEERAVAAEAIRYHHLVGGEGGGGVGTEKTTSSVHHVSTTKGGGSSASSVKSSDDTVKSTIEPLPKYQQSQPPPTQLSAAATGAGVGGGPYSLSSTSPLESPPYVAAPTPMDAGLDDYFANLSDDEDEDGDDGGGGVAGSGDALNFQYGGIGTTTTTTTGDEKDINDETEEIDNEVDDDNEEGGGMYAEEDFD